MKNSILPNKCLWLDQLPNYIETVETSAVIEDTEKEYFEMVANRESYSPKVLEKHLDEHIFPHIALYKSLSKKVPKEKALFVTEKLHFATLKSKKKWFDFIGKYRWGFGFTRFALPLVLKTQHPKPGWDIEKVENSTNMLNYRINSCFYYEMIKKYGYEELAIIFCNGDDYVFDNSDLKMKWGRKNAIPRGASFCDTIFYYEGEK